jgi:hypothetical protein
MSTNLSESIDKTKPSKRVIVSNPNGQREVFTQNSKTGEKGTTSKKTTLISLDWLDLKFSAGNLNLECFDYKGQTFFYSGNECYRLELLPYGGYAYRSKADVFYGDSKLGNIEFDSIYQSQEKTAKFHVENSCFYDEWENVCLESIIKNFAKSIGATVIGVLRADIALDSLTFESLAWNVYNHDILPIRQSSLKGGHWTTDKERLTRITTGFSYGARKSGRLFRCYDKSLEISEKSKHKTYILDYWKNNNLNQLGGHVWRLEAELRNDFLKTVADFNWQHVFDKKRLLSLFQVAQKNYFEFVDMKALEGAKNAEQRKKRFQRAKRVQFIDFTQVHTDEYKRLKIAKKPKTDRTAKIMIKQLASSAVLTVENEPEKALAYAKAAGLLMQENSLDDYVKMKTHFWRPQIEREAWRQGRAVNSMVDLANLATSLIGLQNVYV